MRAMDIIGSRAMTSDVREISRINRFPETSVKGRGIRKRYDVILKLKVLSISVFAVFVALTCINEGTRSWLRASEQNVEQARNFVQPQNVIVPKQVIQPVTSRDVSEQHVRMIREENRYHVQMVREQNRFANNLLSHAMRMTREFSR